MTDSAAFMAIKNNVTLIMDPCGTPLSKENISDTDCLNLTRILRHFRKLAMKMRIGPLTFKPDSIFIICLSRACRMLSLYPGRQRQDAGRL